VSLKIGRAAVSERQKQQTPQKPSAKKPRETEDRVSVGPSFFGIESFLSDTNYVLGIFNSQMIILIIFCFVARVLSAQDGFG
jgi:hypothetical protein